RHRRPLDRTHGGGDRHYRVRPDEPIISGDGRGAVRKSKDRSDPMAEQTWYYTRGGQQVSPVSAEELRRLASAGQVAREELVWREGMTEWQPLHAVAELQPPSSG